MFQCVFIFDVLFFGRLLKSSAVFCSLHKRTLPLLSRRKVVKLVI